MPQNITQIIEDGINYNILEVEKTPGFLWF